MSQEYCTKTSTASWDPLPFQYKDRLPGHAFPLGGREIYNIENPYTGKTASLNWDGPQQGYGISIVNALEIMDSAIQVVLDYSDVIWGLGRLNSQITDPQLFFRQLVLKTKKTSKLCNTDSFGRGTKEASKAESLSIL